MTTIETYDEAIQRLKRAEQQALAEVGVPWGGLPTDEQRATVIAKLRAIANTEFSQHLQDSAAAKDHPIDGLHWTTVDKDLREALFAPHSMKRTPFRM